MTSQTPQEKKCICPEPNAIKGEFHLSSCPLYLPPAQEEKKETCCSGSTECTCLVKQPPQLAKEEKCQASKCENLAEFERYSSTLDGFGIKTGMMRLFKVCKKHSIDPPQPKEPETEKKDFKCPLGLGFNCNQDEKECVHTRDGKIIFSHQLQSKEPETWEKLIKHTEECMRGIGCSCDHHKIIKRLRHEIKTARLSAAAEERKRVCEEIERELPKKKETSGDLSFRTYDYNEGFNWAINKIEETIQSLKP